MRNKRQKAWARKIMILSAVGIFLCTGYLTIDHLQARWQETEDKALVEEMEEAVRMDSAVSVDLTAERERQTQQSLSRRTQNNRVAKILLFSSVVFLISVNWRKSLESDPVLSLERLQQLRGVSTPASLAADSSPLVPLEPAQPPEVDLSFVEQIVDREGQTTDAAIPILRAVQQHYGYLPDEALKKVCELTEITPAQIAGTSTFYAQFRRTPVGKHVVRICHGTACHVSGAVQVTEELRRFLSIADDADTDPSRLFTLDKVACLGCCSLAPVMMIDDHTVGHLSPAQACLALVNAEKEGSE